MSAAPRSSPRPSSIELADETATAALAVSVARAARPRDVIALEGPLGSGKTSFARAFLRALGVAEEVPSPTFTLVQTYETAKGTVWHFDLYRVKSAAEAEELGLEEALIDGIVLIEWPDRLGRLLPADHLAIALASGRSANARIATLSGTAEWLARLGMVPVDG